MDEPFPEAHFPKIARKRYACKQECCFEVTPYTWMVAYCPGHSGGNTGQSGVNGIVNAEADQDVW